MKINNNRPSQKQCGKQRNTFSAIYRSLTVSLPFVLCACVSSPVAKGPATIETYDDLLVKMSREVPGFGGMFFDDANNLNVYLTVAQKLESSNAPDIAKQKVKAALTKVFGKDLSAESALRAADGTSVSSDILFLEGKYNIAELARLRNEANKVFALEGVTYTDLDEAANRVKIGIASESVRAQVVTILEKARVPAEAVDIVVSPPAVDLALLSDYVRPLAGGLQIQNDKRENCTLGLIATHNGAEIPVHGFLTNSHCTNIRGGDENTDFYQDINPEIPNTEPNRLIGVEYKDPALRHIPGLTWEAILCSPGIYVCRYSDAAFVQFYPYISNVWLADTIEHSVYQTEDYVLASNDWSKGSVDPATNIFIPDPKIYTGSLAIPPKNEWGNVAPAFLIMTQSTMDVVLDTHAYRKEHVAVGEYLVKTGAATGLTGGVVTQTCVHQPAGQGILYLCQNHVSKRTRDSYPMNFPIASQGDSGALVFAHGMYNKWPMGLVWAKINDNTFVYSAMKHIETELGPMTIGEDDWLY